MSKIRVIDLLNKIANGEKLPEEFYYRNTLFVGGFDSEDSSVFNYVGFKNLNDEIELIEEEKKVELPELIEDNPNYGGITQELVSKLNDTLKYLKYKEEESKKC